MAFNEFDDRGRVLVIEDCAGDKLGAKVFPSGNLAIATKDPGDGLLFQEDDKDNVRAFANALLRWCDTGHL